MVLAMLKGKTLHHVKFGAGTVVAETEDTVSLHFRGSEQRNRGVTRSFLKTMLADKDVFPRHLNPEL
jgi:hypothetical protein